MSKNGKGRKGQKGCFEILIDLDTHLSIVDVIREMRTWNTILATSFKQRSYYLLIAKVVTDIE